MCARIPWPCAADVGLVRHAVTAAMSYFIELYDMRGTCTCAHGSVVCLYDLVLMHVHARPMALARYLGSEHGMYLRNSTGSKHGMYQIVHGF